MANYNDFSAQPDISPPGGPPQQNWGLIIGAGIIGLVMVLIVVNVSGSAARLAASLPISPFWLKVGRLGLVAGVGLAGWGLWHQFGRRQIHTQTYLSQATYYTRQIEELLKNSPNGHEQQLLTQIYTWQQTIEVMAQVLVYLEQKNRVSQNDWRSLPALIAQLEQQLVAETNPLLRADLEQMLRQRQNQRLALEQLQVAGRRAEIQIERTIAVLSTIYSQLLLYRSTSQMVDYHHLADNVADEVQHLQDYLAALEEVKGARWVGHPTSI